jgi:prefoldin subunit 5
MNKNVRNKMFSDERIPQILQNIEDINTEITTIQTDITTIENNITNLQTDITNIQNDITTIQGDITTIQGDITTIQGDITTINTTLAGLASYETTDIFIAVDSPALFGNLTCHFARTGKLVNCVIEAKTYDFTGSPQNTISTLGGVIPTSYRLVANVLYPLIFKSIAVYDTGLVGNVIVSSAGAFIFSRDNDAAPSDFDGVAGWSWAIALSWLTA